MSAPLAGLVVVSIEQAVAAPFASRQLADLGATVIKVEPPGGDFARHYDAAMAGQSVNFAWANRGKQSLVLDLGDAVDRARLEALLAGADVALQNLAPATARRHAVDADSVLSRYPSVIACGISGYGPDGPRADSKAYDLLIQAEAGAFSVTGDEQMSKVGFSVADICAGMYALSAILAALVRRDRTGEGAAIEVSMLDCLVEWMSAPLYAAVYGGEQAPRTGHRHHSIAPYGTFVLADGSTILLAVQNDREWQALANQALGLPDLGRDERFATNPERIANVEELEQIVGAALRSMPAEDARDALAAARIAVAEVNDLAGVWQHEQLRARDRFRDVETPTGTVTMLASPFEISGWEAPAGSVPALDDHDPSL